VIFKFRDYFSSKITNENPPKKLKITEAETGLHLLGIVIKVRCIHTGIQLKGIINV